MGVPPWPPLVRKQANELPPCAPDDDLTREEREVVEAISTEASGGLRDVIVWGMFAVAFGLMLLAILL
jgi:hypothetical protein